MSISPQSPNVRQAVFLVDDLVIFVDSPQKSCVEILLLQEGIGVHDIAFS